MVLLACFGGIGCWGRVDGWRALLLVDGAATVENVGTSWPWLGCGCGGSRSRVEGGKVRGLAVAGVWCTPLRMKMTRLHITTCRFCVQNERVPCGPLWFFPGFLFTRDAAMLCVGASSTACFAYPGGYGVNTTLCSSAVFSITGTNVPGSIIIAAWKGQVPIAENKPATCTCHVCTTFLHDSLFRSCNDHSYSSLHSLHDLVSVVALLGEAVAC